MKNCKYLRTEDATRDYDGKSIGLKGCSMGGTLIRQGLRKKICTAVEGVIGVPTQEQRFVYCTRGSHRNCLRFRA